MKKETDREIRIDEESVSLCNKRYPALNLNCAECAECEFEALATQRVDADLDHYGRRFRYPQPV